MKKILACLLLRLPLVSFGQEYELPKLKKEALSASDFAPKGWFVTDSIQGDLNNDDLADKVFIIKSRDSVNVRDDGDDYFIQPRMIAIAIKNIGNSYTLAETNPRLLTLCNFPPTYGDPFNLMTIENGVLTIQFSFDYINANFRFYTYTFRFQKNMFLLIGAETEYVKRRTMDFEKSSYNFVIKKGSLTIGTHATPKPADITQKTTWFDLTLVKPKTLGAMGPPGTWLILEDKRL